jgi:hypothetical protein
MRRANFANHVNRYAGDGRVVSLAENEQMNVEADKRRLRVRPGINASFNEKAHNNIWSTARSR